MNLSPYIDHTLLSLNSTSENLVKLCHEAMQYKFASVMIYQTNVTSAKALVSSPVKVGTVIGFPSGRMATSVKRAEIDYAAVCGADEVDIVINYENLLNGNPSKVAAEVNELTAHAHSYNLLVKYIVETCYLNTEAKLTALKTCEQAGADFIKTSTGFGAGGATLQDIELWAKARTSKIKIKASGGIKTTADAIALINAGAERLGTSSGIALLAGLQTNGY